MHKKISSYQENILEVVYLPQRVVCGKCDKILYEGVEVIQPIDILMQYNNICPNCGRKMEYNLSKIRLTTLKSLTGEAMPPSGS